MRPIMSAREQVEMLAPWRTAAPEPPKSSTYWHITDNPDFKPDPSFSPEKNTTMGGNMKPGLFVSQNPSHWMNGYGYWRPYMSEIEVPHGLPGMKSDLSPEMYIPAEHYDKLKVKRTIPIDAYAREQYGDGWVESQSGKDFMTGEQLQTAPWSTEEYVAPKGEGRYKFPGTAMDYPESWRKGWEKSVADHRERNKGIIARVAKTAALPDGYRVHLFNTSGYGDGIAGIYPSNVKPNGSNWHSALSWDRDGKITNLDTRPQHQGKGLARSLYEHVKGTWRPDLMHDHALTADGKAFAEAVGGQPYDHEEYQRRRQQRDVERKLPWEEREQLMKSRGWPSTPDKVGARTSRVAMPTYKHLTNNPNFSLDPHFTPEGPEDSLDKGLYVTDDEGLDLWRSDDYGWDRPYTADISIPHGVGEWRNDYEMFVPAEHFDKLKVGPVKPTPGYDPSKYARRRIAEDYRMNHTAPGPEDGFPLHNMSGSEELGGVPDDWHTHPQHYTYGEVSPRELKSVQQMYQRTNGNPHEMVDIYRALPHGHDDFNTGDWVTPSLEYARQHAMHPDDPAQDMPVIKSTVPAAHLYHNGDSYFEMGYHGPSHKGQEVPRG